MKDILPDNTDMKFDVRLLDKKVQHGFLTHEDVKNHLKTLPEEAEYEFTSAEALDQEEAPASA